MYSEADRHKGGVEGEALSDRLCRCGCGQFTTVAYRSWADRGIVKGEPRPFVRGHRWARYRLRVVRWEPPPWVVDPVSGCWEKSTHLDSRGYPVCERGGVRRRLYRVMFVEAGGVIPEGFDLHHECENKLCVNPAHMRALSKREHGLIHGYRGWEVSRHAA